MLSLFIFLTIMFFKADAQGPDTDPVEITFKIQSVKVKNGRTLICDHNDNNKNSNEYTVLEGADFKINTKYNSDINCLICLDHNKNDNVLHYEVKGALKNVTLKADKRMGTIWNCTMLAHRDDPTVLPVIHYEKHEYSAAYCYMKIHVRQRKSPQTIHVNNMVLQAVRTDLSEKDVDFIAEYQYADGDVVDVTCVDYLRSSLLTMEYEMAGTMSDNSTMAYLSSYGVIGFVAKLHSGHDNNYMICTITETNDYTKVTVRFVMRTNFNNVISVRINGMTLRPKLTVLEIHHFEIEYKYESFQPITVLCEVQRTDMKLVVMDKNDFVGKLSSYKKTELILTKKAEMSFYLESTDDKTLSCSSNYISGTSAELVIIRFTAAKSSFNQDKYHVQPLQMELPSKGIVMEVYNDDEIFKRKVIYYEFEDGETLQLKCGSLLAPTPGPSLHLLLKETDKCKTNGCGISKTLQLTRKDNNTKIACYLKDENYPFGGELMLIEIRVILSVIPTTSTSTTTTTPLVPALAATNPTADLAASTTSSGTFVYRMSAVFVVAVITTLVILYFTVQKLCCGTRLTSQELPPIPTPRLNPDNVFYLNLLSVFQPINEREAAEMENHYEEID